MGTKAQIGIIYETGEVKVAVCNWDGYYSNIIPILKTDAWSSILKIETLISYGEFAALEILLEDIRTYEDAQSAISFGCLDEFKREGIDYSYIYLYDVINRTWLVFNKNTRNFESLDVFTYKD